MSYIEKEKAIENVSQIRLEVVGARAVGKTIFTEALRTYRDAVLKSLNEAPTADVVEVRHGEWKKHFSYGCWHYDCPFCDDGFAVTDEFEINQLPRYCSNCGAKMDGERREG